MSQEGIATLPGDFVLESGRVTGDPTEGVDTEGVEIFPVTVGVPTGADPRHGRNEGPTAPPDPPSPSVCTTGKGGGSRFLSDKY